MVTQKKLSIHNTLGLIAIFLWSTGSLAASHTTRLPPFQILAIALSLNIPILACKLLSKKNWHVFKLSPSIWLVGLGGTFGQLVTFILAFKYAPPAYADVIIHLWPLFVMVMMTLIFKTPFEMKYKISLMLGIAAIFLLNCNQEVCDFTPTTCLGLFFAAVCGGILAFYTAFFRNSKANMTELISYFLGFSGVLSCIFHLQFESFVQPTFVEACWLGYMAMMTHGLAYYGWNAGLKGGNIKLLTSMCCAIPVLSINFLCLFGNSTYTREILLASLLIMAGCVINCMHFRPVEKLKLAES